MGATWAAQTARKYDEAAGEDRPEREPSDGERSPWTPPTKSPAPPPGVDLLIDFAIVELGVVVTSYEATQDSISSPIHGKGKGA